uniref:Uncharacterized protein n=1 Tax=Bionectria ochroleuca TaxID=29856 RepID=A0A0B7K4W4_BIOOC
MFIGAWAIVCPCNRTCDHKRPARKLDQIELRQSADTYLQAQDTSVSALATSYRLNTVGQTSGLS